MSAWLPHGLKVFVECIRAAGSQMMVGWSRCKQKLRKLVTILDNEREQWIHISSGIDAYVESVRELADTMAINGGVLLQPCQFQEKQEALVLHNTCNLRIWRCNRQQHSRLLKELYMKALGCCQSRFGAGRFLRTS